MDSFWKVLRKIEPFFENIFIGFLFVGIGIHIFTTFNNNFFGFFGVIAIFWGGFKILIGLVIYGLYGWALFFKPESILRNQQNNSIERVMIKVKKDIEMENLQKAKDRLHGLLSKYPNLLKIRFKLSEIYLLEGDLKNAGRYLYLKPNPNSQECKCIREFEDSLGNNPFQILRKIVIPRKINSDFVLESKIVLSDLVKRVHIESEKGSLLILTLTYYLKESDVPFYIKLVKNQKDLLIHILVLIALLGLIEVLEK